MHTPPHGTLHRARSDDCAALSGHATAARRESWRPAETRSTASIPHAAYERRAAWEQSAARARAPGHRGPPRPTAAPRTCAACSAAAPARACACPAPEFPACRRARRCTGTRDGPAPAARLRPAERVGGAQGRGPPWRCASACTCPPLGNRSGRAAELARLGLRAGGHTDRATARHAGSFPGRRPRSRSPGNAPVRRQRWPARQPARQHRRGSAGHGRASGGIGRGGRAAHRPSTAAACAAAAGSRGRPAGHAAAAPPGRGARPRRAPAAWRTPGSPARCCTLPSWRRTGAPLGRLRGREPGWPAHGGARMTAWRRAEPEVLTGMHGVTTAPLSQRWAQ